MATNTQLAHRPSILQDLEAGRPMEIDALYSVPLEMARLVGVATPTLDLLVALIRVKARARGLYAALIGCPMAGEKCPAVARSTGCKFFCSAKLCERLIQLCETPCLLCRDSR